MNLPNTLTLVRMFLVPLLVVVLLTEFEGRQILGPGRLSEGGPQAAALGHGRGDVVLGPVARLMVLVGQQVLGRFGPPDGSRRRSAASASTTGRRTSRSTRHCCVRSTR